MMMMMNERNDASEKNTDDSMLPGFRFHPTDEELVGFYLKKKLQQKTLPIELIKQVDIYKYDPWDLPNLASSGEKEWYFYCPRDRKYRNSTRPNRVTGSGFWKATGTDRPIYSSSNRCIGLKKSLVFYRGRAAKGIKTDWMMHEFRLPSITDCGSLSQQPNNKNIPANDSWAICRIFKKANSAANRALSHPNWADDFTYSPHHHLVVASVNTSSTTKHDLQPMNLSALNIPGNWVFPPHEEVNKNTLDLTSMNSNISPAVLTGDDFDGPPQCQFGGYPSRGMHNVEEEQEGLRKNVSYLRSMGFPFDLQPSFSWDDSPTCPSEISSTTNY